ncbi:hypothetical protein HHI36_011284 [Cryptolaemus montrouzieri]|uniref:Uncharacterized protein n=1 Tax=Cryptolaemus montrouzieri TaxID=559131 RepID=A0ABD2ML83_9CUCU
MLPVVERMLSPIGATPAANRCSSKLERSPDQMQNQFADASSSSESGSDSGSDSDSSSEDSENDNVPETQQPAKAPTPPPSVVETESKPEEESKKRWNLASYIVSENNDPISSPKIQLSPLSSPEKPAGSKQSTDYRKKLVEESDTSDSTKDVDMVLSQALSTKPAPLLSSFSDSDVSSDSTVSKNKKLTNQIVTRRSDDSDSDDGRTNKIIKPPMHVRARTKSVNSSDSDSDYKPTNSKPLSPEPRNSIPKEVVKPKSNRGRPRKIKQDGSETGEVKVKKRGRPRLPKNNHQSNQRSSSASDVEVPVKKRGRPRKRQTPPSSSDEEYKAKPSARNASKVSISSDDNSISRTRLPSTSSVRNESDRDSSRYETPKST